MNVRCVEADPLAQRLIESPRESLGLTAGGIPPVGMT